MIQSLATVSGVSNRSAVFGVPQLGLAAPASAPASFGDLMVQVATNAKEAIQAGEANAIAGLQGKASTQAVVEAVMSAEQTLQTAIAVRDKVVAAYQEIVRMAV
ncbi:flagellar hook-basal body complex protein FliE [Methylobacterium sp. 1030]|uniref:flagellar hook-basal body complex protein FliE n=1 Tax=Methylobacterium sp. 1030 TaxID=3156404 RepID=UPI0033950138